MKRMLMFLFVLLLGCTVEEPLIPCSNEVDLGVLSSKELVPYHDFLVLNFENSSGIEEIVSVNHPQQLSFYSKNRVEIIAEADCSAGAEIDSYVWTIDQRNSIITFGFNGKAEEIFIFERSYVVDPESKDLEYFISFSKRKGSGEELEEPFMRLSDTDWRTDRKTEIGFDFYENYENAGFEFENVFINKSKLDLAADYILFNAEDGLVGFIDQEENIWRLK